MKTYLNVPYSEKDQVKKLGAKWDAASKRWYVENVANLGSFMKWMPSHLKKPHKPLARATPPRQ